MEILDDTFAEAGEESLRLGIFSITGEGPGYALGEICIFGALKLIAEFLEETIVRALPLRRKSIQIQDHEFREAGSIILRQTRLDLAQKAVDY